MGILYYCLWCRYSNDLKCRWVPAKVSVICWCWLTFVNVELLNNNNVRLVHALFSNKLYIIPWLGWIPTNACSQIRVSVTSADCFVAMLYRENWKISNNMDSFILHQDTLLIMEMMKSKLYIYLAMYVRIPILFLLYTYHILIYISYLLNNEHNLN